MKTILNGLKYALLMMLIVMAGLLLVLFPALIVEATSNSYWGWLYLIHGVFGLYVIGNEYKDEG